MKRLRTYLPALEWGSQYSGKALRGDLLAGLTVGVMLIPQGMAYAMLAGMPPIYGLYASLVPLAMYALLGTSPYLAIGPVATISLLVVAGIGPLAVENTPEFVGLAILLAFLVGGMQVLLGLMRLGGIVHFLSRPVVKGYTSAAAIMIAFSQLKPLLGLDMPRGSTFYETLVSFVQHLDTFHWQTAVLGLGAVLVLWGLRKLNPALPGPLVVVVLGILALLVWSANPWRWDLVGQVPAGLPGFAFPEWEWATIRSLLPVAATIALVSFVESNAIARSLSNHQQAKTLRPNQELLALGAANLLGSLFRGFPVSGSFSRSALTRQAGGQTPAATFVSALAIGLTLLVLTHLFQDLPLAILGAIIFAAVLRLVDYREAQRLWRVDKVDFGLMTVTFVGSLVLGMVPGIILGALLSLATVIYRSAYPHFAVLGRLEDSNLYRNRLRFPEVVEEPEVLVFRFDAQLYFANSSYFRRQLEQLMADKGPELKRVVLNAESISFIDSTGVAMLRGMLEEMAAKGIRFEVAGALGPVRDVLFKTGLAAEIGSEAMFNDVAEAMGETEGGLGQDSPALQNFARQSSRDLRDNP